MKNWSVELSQFDVRYEPCSTIKAQVMVDLLAEMTHSNPDIPTWELHVDGASKVRYGGAGLILTKGKDVVIAASIKFDSPISNNQVAYEALLVGMALAWDAGVMDITVFKDSQLVTSQVNGEYQARDLLLQQYLKSVHEEVKTFDSFSIKHVPREQNTRANVLSKFASTKPRSENCSLI
ncbi:uncharacterized protein [Arachis hypogaea]|uniref:uncharacterized protein n=1 Tax=Arachis hypogaea TaxID=3818 RepID=UPI003B21EA9D